MSDKKDNPIWLEKGNGLGWTLNFENKWSYVILTFIILLLVFVIVYGYFFQK